MRRSRDGRKPVRWRPQNACPAEGCSVTGGYVYRGSSVPDLDGHYFFGDLCDGRVRSFRLSAGGDDVTDLQTWDLGSLGSITSFGVDASGELYVVVHEGRIYRLAPA